jgi:hypothetical protein
MNNVPLSSVVLSQFPEFSYPTYSKFISFLELYYKFNEQSRFKTFDNISSLDDNLEEFVQHIKYQLGSTLPSTTVKEDHFINHHLKEFYSSKGTEEAFRILFRHMFGKEINISYPRDLILKASDGRWIQPVSVILLPMSGDPNVFSGNYVTITTPQKSFDVFVTRIKNLENGTYEVFFEPFYYSDVSVGCLISFESTMGVIQPCLSTCKIQKKGFNFKEGQIFNVKGGEGENAKIKIVKTDQLGSIQKIQIFDFGRGFKSDFSTSVISKFTDVVVSEFPNVTENTNGFQELLQFSKQWYSIDFSADDYAGEIISESYFDLSTDKGTFDEADVAYVEFNVGVLQRYPGYYASTNGFLSDTFVLQDNHYFQLFSYVIQISENIDKFKDVVKRILNPAGYAMFSEYSITNEIDMSASVNSAIFDYKLFVQDLVSTLNDTTFNEIIKPLIDTINNLESITTYITKTLTDTANVNDSGGSIKLRNGTLSYTLDDYFASDYSQGLTIYTF